MLRVLRISVDVADREVQISCVIKKSDVARHVKTVVCHFPALFGIGKVFFPWELGSYCISLTLAPDFAHRYHDAQGN